MTEYVVEAPAPAIEDLEESIRQGPILEIKDGTGSRFLTEETVDRIKGLKVEIFSDEHPPPHFRVKYQNSTANYQISDCVRLNGSGEILRYEKNIVLWWQTHKALLIETWNRRRPADCPVGEFRE
jgi:hypothetical protein